MQLEYFRMIDKVTALHAGERRISCVAQVPQASSIFEGHFPGYPLMPGALLIETMAQASGYLVLQLVDFTRMPFFIGADGVRLRQFVLPGDSLAIEAELKHEGSGFSVTGARITRAGEKICEAELKFRLMPFPDESFAGMIRDQAASLGLEQAIVTA